MTSKKFDMANMTPIIVLVVLCIFMAILSPVFASTPNLVNIMQQLTVNAIIALGLTVVIFTGGIDLSVGSILAICGIVMGKLIVERLAGFRDMVENKPGFEIVASQTANCDRNMAFNVMQNVLTSNPDVNIVWAINAEMGQGAIQAIEQAGKVGKISVFDFDASNDDVMTIKEGTLVGSVAQYPDLQARAAIEAALKAMKGEKLPSHTVTKAELITKENVGNM